MADSMFKETSGKEYIKMLYKMLKIFIAWLSWQQSRRKQTMIKPFSIGINEP
jgi:hypothetical protein